MIGHKGAAGLAPENSLEAFRAAREVGADGVELDVRRTADGALAVHHDPALGDGRRLLDLAADELPAGIVTLPTVLDACAGLALVNVEVKNWPLDADFDETLAIVDQVVEVLAARPPAERERYVVSCFHLPTVDRVRELAPDLVTAWLVGIVGPDGGAQVIAEAVDHGHRALHPHHALVTRELVERAHDEELAVNAWTCNEPDRIRWLAGEAGVDGIVTDVPDVALVALGRGPGQSP
ncbi:MAG TPA: glycerophosphodiester phosphodiesterase [Acidimicrobiales bacterium]|nr:glycerophosphodiester phosphodiesterase [Acidimicrobiales bacterium]